MGNSTLKCSSKIKILCESKGAYETIIEYCFWGDPICVRDVAYSKKEKEIEIGVGKIHTGSELAQSVKRPSVEPKIPGSTPTQADD